MKLRHFILTRFGYRTANSSATGTHSFDGAPDPLDPARLLVRFEVFQIVCLPGILSQTDQDFDWILIVDKDLPESDRSRLLRLTSVRPRTHLHVYRPDQDVGRLDFLSEYLTETPTHVLTTIVDDDDAMPRTYVARLHEHIHEVNGGVLPPFKVIATTNATQWTMVFSRRHAMGTTAPFHRHAAGKSFPVSCGCSLLCRYPDYPYTILRVPHRACDIIFDDSKPLYRPKEIATREEFKHLVSTYDPAWTEWEGRQLFFDVGKTTAPVVMTNHGFNVQVLRITEAKPGETAVVGAESFSEVGIDWEKARASEVLKKRACNYVRMLRAQILWDVRTAKTKSFFAQFRIVAHRSFTSLKR
jgi:hypothetical protein